MAIAAGFPSFHAVPAVQAVFRGISAVVVALIAAAALRLAGQRRDFFTYVTGGLGLCALLFLRISPFLLVLVLVPVGIARALIRKHNGTSPDTNAGMTLGD